MKNSTQKNSALAAAIDSEYKGESEKSGKKTLIKLDLRLIELFLLLLVYYYWQRIPTKEHYFQAEYIASADSIVNCRAEFQFYDPKVLDSKDGFAQTWPTEFANDSKNSEKTEARENKCVFFPAVAKESCVPLRPCSENHLSDYIGQPIYDELRDYCDDNKIDLNKLTELFFYRHFDNEKTRYWTKRRNHEFSHDASFLHVIERNSFELSDLDREKSLGIKTYGFDGEISKKSLKKSSNFTNVTQSFVLSNGKTIPSTLLRAKATTGFGGFFLTIFRMEDISQSYYLIKLRSNSFRELSLKMDFVGTIECLVSDEGLYNKINTGRIKVSIDTIECLVVDEDSCGAINTDTIKVKTGTIECLVADEKSRSTISIDRNRVNIKALVNGGYPTDVNLHMLVKFNDMENMQITRLFILGIIITWVIGKIINLVAPYVKKGLHWLGDKVMAIHLLKRKKSNKEETSDPSGES